ncbi:pilus assembly protein [Methylobacterium sp. BTF04]|uniref:TadE/TadG family type IV pilus assembly protein n=1 Tax=Methylobacterium sp. BTF04 TaxID=2708300 RepID=UPI0013D3AAA4|nr:TadE/TadG family type IV pilus assembly protein [Methylobacterium sp. BTF04]NEU11225.1 pilus assembly protein [Methylobacterium sp. BTF04]
MRLSLARTFRECIDRFRSASSGSAAVEFALVSLPFFMLLGGIIQWCFIIWAQTNLDFMVERAERNLFTGNFQTANTGVTDPTTLLANLKTVMCGSGTSAVATVFVCNNVKLNVSSASSFASSASATAYDPATKAISAKFEGYTCAKPGQIVVVTAVVSLSVFFAKLLPGLTGMADGSYLMRSTGVFRTEPYSSTSTGAC